MDTKTCRLWWPDPLFCRISSSGLLVFGWCMQSVNSIDIIVAGAISACVISSPHSHGTLQEMLHRANRKMPVALKESTTLAILGHCASLVDGKSYLKMVSVDYSPSIDCKSKCEGLKCGCEILDRDTELYRKSALRDGIWIQLISNSQNSLEKGYMWIPELHHFHLNGYLLHPHDIHMIIYKPPSYGHHHFSLHPWNSSKQLETPLCGPSWLIAIHENPHLLDMGNAVLFLNCTPAVEESLRGFLGDKSQCRSMLASFVWRIAATITASVSSVVYMIIQSFRRLLDNLTGRFFYMLFGNIFVNASKNLHIRCCQFIFWPLFIQSYGFSSHSSVEYAHKAALRKHQMWFNMTIDLLLGNLIGLYLFLKAEAFTLGMVCVARYMTDDLMRSGCVWLMGVPAGFKLNTELAELLGMISLNAIQAFAALSFLLRSFLELIIKSLGLLGAVLGLTVLCALCIDIIKLVTLHIFILHCAISFLYALQMQALAALWRLFRGHKWNPLRQRLDSYNYNVEQHIVGSLTFTPILLLLPTTSVFYVFFTMLSITISLLCISIEIFVSILHATPYCEVLVWMVRRRRFPSGIWFNFTSLPKLKTSVKDNLLHEESQWNTGSRTTLLDLQSNYATLGQIVGPSFRSIFRSVSWSSFSAAVRGVLSGQRIPSSLGTALPPTIPWMQVGICDYWRLCYDSVLEHNTF